MNQDHKRPTDKIFEDIRKHQLVNAERIKNAISEVELKAAEEGRRAYQTVFGAGISTRTQTQKLLDDLTRQAKQVYEVYYNKEYVKFLDAFRKQSEDVLKIFVPNIEQIQKSIKPLQQQAQFAFKIFSKFQKKYKEEKESLAALSEVGFILAPSMDKSFLECVKNYKKKNSIRGIYTALRRYYRKDNFQKLRKLVESLELNPILKPRINIIKDAFWAHIEKKYTLSIPTLLPQIEGAIIDYRLQTDPSPENVIGKKEIKKTLFSADGMASLVIYEGLNEFIDKRVYEGKDFRYLPISNRKILNRNIVMHGRQIKYATEINSLRAFLVLDALSVMLIPPDNTTPKRRKTKGNKSKTKQ